MKQKNPDTVKMNLDCDHSVKVGDNYGETCQFCKKVLAGYGVFGQEKTCIHGVWYRIETDEGKTSEQCAYCEQSRANIERKPLWTKI